LEFAAVLMIPSIMKEGPVTALLRSPRARQRPRNHKITSPSFASRITTLSDCSCITPRYFRPLGRNPHGRLCRQAIVLTAKSRRQSARRDGICAVGPKTVSGRPVPPSSASISPYEVGLGSCCKPNSVRLTLLRCESRAGARLGLRRWGPAGSNQNGLSVQ
jgi:hypothetical protein